MFRLILSCVQGPGSIKTRMGAQAANAAAKASTKTLSWSLNHHCYQVFYSGVSKVLYYSTSIGSHSVHSWPSLSGEKREIDAIVEEECQDWPRRFLSWSLLQIQSHPAHTYHQCVSTCASHAVLQLRMQKDKPNARTGVRPALCIKIVYLMMQGLAKPGWCILKQQTMTSRVRISSYLLYI